MEITVSCRQLFKDTFSVTPTKEIYTSPTATTAVNLKSAEIESLTSWSSIGHFVSRDLHMIWAGWSKNFQWSLKTTNLVPLAPKNVVQNDGFGRVASRWLFPDFFVALLSITRPLGPSPPCSESLLLSKRALRYPTIIRKGSSKPVPTHDVHCSHGAIVG